MSEFSSGRSDSFGSFKVTVSGAEKLDLRFCDKDITWTVDLESLRAWLVLRPATAKAPAEYGRYVDLERRILVPAERELSRLAGMLLSHREIKRERKVVALEFSLFYRCAPSPGLVALGAEPAANPVSAEELPFVPDPVVTTYFNPVVTTYFNHLRASLTGPRGIGGKKPQNR